MQQSGTIQNTSEPNKSSFLDTDGIGREVHAHAAEAQDACHDGEPMRHALGRDVRPVHAFLVRTQKRPGAMLGGPS